MAKLVYGPLSPTKRGKRGRDHGLDRVPGPDLGAIRTSCPTGGGSVPPAARLPTWSRCRAQPQRPPYAAKVFASTVAHSSERSFPRVAAIKRMVCGMRYDALGRPRYGVGVR